MVDSPGRGWSSVCVFAGACVVGGVTTGLAVAVAGGLLPVSPPSEVLAVGVAVLFCVALARDLGLVRFWLPENRRQVRQTVLRLRPVVGDVMFGFELGTGARTYVPATAPYLAAIAVVVAADGFVPGLVAGAGFGLGRGLVVVDRMLRRDRQRWDRIVKRHVRALPVVGLVMTVALLFAVLTNGP